MCQIHVFLLQGIYTKMLRPYTKKDYAEVYYALVSEGLCLNEMTFKTDQTFITEDGFFSFIETGEYPELRHFYVNKSLRIAFSDSMRAARKLFKTFRNIMLAKKCLFFIAEAPRNKPYMKRLIKYLKGKECYSNEKSIYYHVPLFGRISNENL